MEIFFRGKRQGNHNKGNQIYLLPLFHTEFTKADSLLRRRGHALDLYKKMTWYF